MMKGELIGSVYFSDATCWIPIRATKHTELTETLTQKIKAGISVTSDDFLTSYILVDGEGGFQKLPI